jgi:cytoskeletal protein RodZ
MNRIKWGGSLTRYIVVSIVLLFLVSGAAYYVQARGNQARLDRASSIAAKQAQTAKAEEQAAEKANQTLATTQVSTPSATGATTSTTTPSTTPVATIPATSALPVTGISFSIDEYVGLGLLSMVAVSYILSRRSLLRTL